jgi:hypothetical protein
MFFARLRLPLKRSSADGLIASRINVLMVLVVAMLLAIGALMGPGIQGVRAQSPEAAEELTRGIYRSEQGPYMVTVQMIPSVPAAGTVHFIVTPELALDGAAVANAIVLVVVDDEEGVPAFQSLALNSPDQPRQYSANLIIPRAGEWTVRVNVQIDGNELDMQLPLTVIDRASTGGELAGTITLLVVLAVLLAGGGYVTLTIRRRTRDRHPRDDHG